MQSMGKKTERLRIAVSEEILRELRALADLHCRKLEDQARFALMEGLSNIRGNRGNGHMGQHGDISGHAVPQGNFAEGQTVPSGATRGQRLPNQLLLPETGGPVPARKRRSA